MAENNKSLDDLIYLSDVQATEMIKQNGYYDRDRNPDGKGIAHQYEAKILNGKKVVIDHTTKLMWQQSGSLSYMYYKDAFKYIDRLNREKFAGFDDWRLPTLEEAMSLMEPTRKNGTLFIDPVFDKTQIWIWISDIYSASWAWYVYFYGGYCKYHDVGIIIASVRAVRSAGSKLII